MTSAATTVAQYLQELPEDRRAAISKVRSVIRKNLPKGYVERMCNGMIAYVVPHRLYPAGYHCNPADPLPFAWLASQKGHMSIYLMSIYQDAVLEGWLRQQFHARGKKADMGKSCIRFKSLDDLPLDVIGQAIARVPVADFIMKYEDGLALRKARGKASG
jgi:uncharacterized protein YdhG (YjbR/CyaY superfamily)